MKNKKGFEASLTIIVLLIITVLIFVVSIGLIAKWFGKAESLKADLDRQTEQQILNALKQTNALVAIPMNLHDVQRSKRVIFGIGVRNPGEQKVFSGSIVFSGAYNPEGQPISTADSFYIEEFWLGNFKNIDSFNLLRNEQKVLSIAVKADTYMAHNQMTQKGDYVFDVCIFDSPVQGVCNINNLNAVFSEKIYQFVIRVV